MSQKSSRFLFHDTSFSSQLLLFLITYIWAIRVYHKRTYSTITPFSRKGFILSIPHEDSKSSCFLFPNCQKTLNIYFVGGIGSSDGATMYIPIPTVYLSIQRPVCGVSLCRKRSSQRTRVLVTILSSLHLPSALGQLAYLFNDLTGLELSWDYWFVTYNIFKKLLLGFQIR